MTLLEIALVGLTAQWATPRPGEPGHRGAALSSFLANLASELDLLSLAIGNDEEELRRNEIQDRLLATAAKLRAADSLFSHHLKEVQNG